MNLSAASSGGNSLSPGLVAATWRATTDATVFGCNSIRQSAKRRTQSACVTAVSGARRLALALDFLEVCACIANLQGLKHEVWRRSRARAVGRRPLRHQDAPARGGV